VSGIKSDNYWLQLSGQWGGYHRVTKSMTLAGGTTNDPGDFDGDGNPATLFEVSGLVAMRVFARCTTTLTGATATLEVGTALTTAGLIAQTTATDIDENEIWHDATPDASIEATTIAAEKIVNQDVIQTVGTANITAGALTYYCFWKPLSEGATVTAA
jgi:hypothetical protein